MSHVSYRERFYSNYAKYYWRFNNKNNVEKDSFIYDPIYLPYLPANRSGRALDCGAGGGIFMYFLKRHGFTKALGVDLCEDLVAFQKNRLGVSAFCGDAIEYLRQAKPGFELIVATEFLEHLKKEEIIEFVCLACDKLSRTGRLFIQVPNMGNPFSTRGQFGDFTHEVAFTERSLEFVAANSGFPHVQIISSFPYDKEPEAFRLLRDLYIAVGNAQAPRILSGSVIAICGHEPIVPHYQDTI